MFKSKTLLVMLVTAFILLTGSVPTSALVDEDRSQEVKAKSAQWMKQMKDAEGLIGSGKLKAAESIYKTILAERQALELDLLTERIALAKLFEKMDRNNEARAQYTALIEERKKQVQGIDDFTVAYPMKEYAAFLDRTGNKKLASELREKVKLIEKDAGSTASDTKLAAKIQAGPGTASAKAEKLRNLGALWLQRSDGRKAMVYLQKSLLLNPKSVEALCDRGETYYFNGNEAAALKDYQKAVTLDSKCARAYFGIGRIMSGRNNLPRAIAEYTKAIANQPTNIDYLGARGKLYDVTGKPKEAIADYTRVLEIRPTCIWARVQRATAYEGMKDFEKAAGDMTALLERYPVDSDFYEYRGHAYLGGGMYDKAVADYGKVAELSPAYAGGYLGRARAYEKLEGKNSKRAKDDYAMAKKYGYTP